ncbi:hypothetical protein [Thermopirellula anaerolimosa]|jgi:hypothetical protein
MGDLLDDGLGWLAEKLKAHASRPIVYRRGADEVTVQAIVGRTLLKLDDGYGGVRMEWTDRDFLIAADDLILAGRRTLPKRGDQIRENQDGKTLVYEVLAPAGQPEWRWSDPHRKLLRIHTKQIGEE